MCYGMTAVRKLRKINARRRKSMTKLMWFIAIGALLGAIGGVIFG